METCMRYVPKYTYIKVYQFKKALTAAFKKTGKMQHIFIIQTMTPMEI